MNNEAIISLTGHVIYNRGEDYYERGLVEFSDSDEVNGNRVFFFNVKGSGRKSYAVLIDELSSHYFCDCPYPRTCKHIVAALLFMSNNDMFDENEEDNLSMDEIKTMGFAELGFIKNELLLERSEEIILKSDKNYIQIYNNYFDYELLPTHSNKRYKLIFTINRDNYSRAGGYIIKPALRYIKKDGTFGRIEKFTRDKITEELTSGDRLLVKSILKEYGSEDFLNRYINVILENDDVDIYIEDSNVIKRLNFIEIEKIKIKFNLHSILNKDVYFNPELVFISPNGEVLSSVKNFNSIEISGLDLFILDDSGNMFFGLNRVKLIDLIYILKSRLGRITNNEIDEVRGFAEKYLPGKVDVDFNAKLIKFNYLSPEVIFEIDEFGTFIEANLIFSYDGKEFSDKGLSQGDSKTFSQIQSESSDEIEIAVRNVKYERAFIQVMETIFSEHIPVKYKMHEYFLESLGGSDFKFKQNLESFIIEHGKDLIENSVELRLKTDKVSIKPSKGKVASRVKTGIDWFEVNTTFLDEDGEELEIELDERLLSSGIIKTGKNYIVLSKDEIEKMQRLKKLGMSNKGGLKLQSINFSAIDEIAGLVEEDENNYLEKQRKIYKKLKSVDKIKNYPLPKKFNGTLREYQRGGYNWLNFMREHKLNALLADDMGLGKTIQTLALLQSLKEKGELTTSLLVVPVSTIPNWEDEIDRFTNDLTSLKHVGQKRVKEYDHIMHYDLIITSYHTLRNDIEFFSGINFDYLILDESQNIKNAVSQSHKAVSRVKSEHRLSLTGTPVENNTTELWAQMNFLNPGLLGTRREFTANYAKPIEKYHSQESAEQLRKIVFPFILRRKKEDVAQDLPEKEEITLYCEMKNDQRVLYEKYRRFYSGKINESINLKGLQKSSMEIFEALLRLRQIALFPEIADEQYENINSCKFDLLKDMVDEIIEEGHKILIFSQFVKSLKIIKNYISEKGYNYSYIDGSVKNRKKEIDNFQKNDDVRIFLLSIKAGGVGINLTAADYVILFDPWWNPAVESQAVDRSHRIGQDKKVFAYRFIVKDTIEEKIQLLQNRKKDLVENIISEDAGFFKSLSGDDILDLFE